MKVTIYGTRGSSPNANTDKAYYGGNNILQSAHDSVIGLS